METVKDLNAIYSEISEKVREFENANKDRILGGLKSEREAEVAKSPQADIVAIDKRLLYENKRYSMGCTAGVKLDLDKIFRSKNAGTYFEFFIYGADPAKKIKINSKIFDIRYVLTYLSPDKGLVEMPEAYRKKAGNAKKTFNTPHVFNMNVQKDTEGNFIEHPGYQVVRDELAKYNHKEISALFGRSPEYPNHSEVISNIIMIVSKSMEYYFYELRTAVMDKKHELHAEAKIVLEGTVPKPFFGPFIDTIEDGGELKYLERKIVRFTPRYKTDENKNKEINFNYTESMVSNRGSKGIVRTELNRPAFTYRNEKGEMVKTNRTYNTMHLDWGKGPKICDMSGKFVLSSVMGKIYLKFQFTDIVIMKVPGGGKKILEAEGDIDNSAFDMPDDESPAVTIAGGSLHIPLDTDPSDNQDYDDL